MLHLFGAFGIFYGFTRRVVSLFASSCEHVVKRFLGLLKFDVEDAIVLDVQNFVYAALVFVYTSAHVLQNAFKFAKPKLLRFLVIKLSCF